MESNRRTKMMAETKDNQKKASEEEEEWDEEIK
jgi:hypothetical protein